MTTTPEAIARLRSALDTLESMVDAMVEDCKSDGEMDEVSEDFALEATLDGIDWTDLPDLANARLTTEFLDWFSKYAESI